MSPARVPARSTPAPFAKTSAPLSLCRQLSLRRQLSLCRQYVHRGVTLPARFSTRAGMPAQRQCVVRAERERASERNIHRKVGTRCATPTDWPSSTACHIGCRLCTTSGSSTNAPLSLCRQYVHRRATLLARWGSRDGLPAQPECDLHNRCVKTSARAPGPQRRRRGPPRLRSQPA